MEDLMQTTAAASLTRRQFIQSVGAGSALLLFGLNSQGVLSAGNAEQIINPFVKINAEGVVTVIIKHFEMGQGTTTGLSTLVAEELDANWETLKTAFAPADTATYKNLLFGAQLTGGSTAIANAYTQYREAGATARDLMVRAAASRWQVPPEQITVENGIVRSNPAGGKKAQAHFGELLTAAAKLTTNPKPTLKTPEQFKLIGSTTLGRKDSGIKADGSAHFAIDIMLPNMVYAVIQRPPKFGATLKSFDDKPAKSIPGFMEAKALPNQQGVVVFAENSWAALKAREAITAEWDERTAEQRDWSEIVTQLQAQAKQNGLPATDVSLEQVKASLDKADRTLDYQFTFPMLAHAPMEPLNCVIEPTPGGGVRFHDGCQSPTLVQGAVGPILGLKPEQIEVNTVYAGGSFGRRATPDSDYQSEAAMAFDLRGRKQPVKLLWSREDDIRGGVLSPSRAASSQDWPLF